jgi:hypothetical protein
VRCNFVLSILLACAVMTPACAKAQAAPAQTSGPAAISTPLLYRDIQYGFCFRLPADWKGYTIVAEKWNGTVLDTNQKESGPQLLIRNPKWTQDDPWQDIPIMIFTPRQWKIVEADNLAVSAAPIGPSELGRNSRYIFALPPRWIGFADANGMDEVQSLISQHPFQTPCAKSKPQPAR